MNEYLAKFNEIGGEEDRFMDAFFEPSFAVADMVDRLKRGEKTNHQWRRELVRQYAWAVPTDEAIAMIAKHSPIVEMGAGTGYWASLLAAAGADILCYDVKPPSEGTKNSHGHKRTYHPVKPGTPRRLLHHSDRALFLCWPPYDKSVAVDCLDSWDGKTLIYIGESDGGCNANDAFFARVDRDFEVIEECDLPQWYGIHDHLTIYQRK